MTKYKENNNSLIVIAVIIIIVIVIVFSSPNIASVSEEKEVQKRNEEEARLKSELEELETKMKIFEKHKSINSFTDDYLKEMCAKRYKQLIQVLIILYVITNAIIYFVVPKTTISMLFTWNTILLAIFNLAAVFFFMSVKKGKEYIKGVAMNYIEYRVYENRDKTYFAEKVNFYNDEIERLKNEMGKKNNDIDTLRNNERISIE